MLMAVLGASALGDEKAAPPAGGSIVGKVSWEGAIPERKRLAVNKDNDACECDAKTGERKPFKLDESLVVDPETKGVAHAVLWLKGVKGGPVIGPAEIDQKGCVYAPHVSVITQGQQVDVLNPDGIVHTFQLWSQANAQGNFSFGKWKKALKVPAEHFRKPEFIRVSCAPHAWMSCWIAVMENGYAARTDGKGAFRIEGVPPGKYTLALWHEPLFPEGKPFLQEREIVVEEGKTVEAGFVLANP
jgi:hypothetical protein